MIYLISTYVRMHADKCFTCTWSLNFWWILNKSGFDKAKEKGKNVVWFHWLWMSLSLKHTVDHILSRFNLSLEKIRIGLFEILFNLFTFVTKLFYLSIKSLNCPIVEFHIATHDKGWSQVSFYLSRDGFPIGCVILTLTLFRFHYFKRFRRTFEVIWKIRLESTQGCLKRKKCIFKIFGINFRNSSPQIAFHLHKKNHPCLRSALSEPDPVATCGHIIFKCSARNFFQISRKWFAVGKYIRLQLLKHIFLNCGNSKYSVTTKLANVATGTVWLEELVIWIDNNRSVALYK